MLRYLWDPANAITSAGLILSSISLYLALTGRLEIAVSLALWSVLADHLDGIVAARTKNRSIDVAKMGKSLDGFADIIYGAVLPAILIIALSAGSTISLISSVCLVLAGALRLSYFENFGFSGTGKFLGVPLSYDIPILALMFLLRPLFPGDYFPFSVNVIFIILSVTHVASIRIPAANNVMYLAIVVFCVGSSILLVERSLA